MLSSTVYSLSDQWCRTKYHILYARNKYSKKVENLCLVGERGQQGETDSSHKRHGRQGMSEFLLYFNMDDFLGES